MEPLDREQIEGIDAAIAGETRRILTEWVGLDPALSPQEAQGQVDREALRLQQLVEDVAPAFEAQALAQWTPPGQRPDFTTKVQARESAWRQAREMVLAQELYSQVSEEMQESKAEYERELDAQIEIEYDRAMLARERGRWKTRNVRPTPVASRIVQRVWLDKPAYFQTLALSLVAQRIEDDQPVPATEYDPLAQELEAMILDEMAANPPTDPTVPF